MTRKSRQAGYPWGRLPHQRQPSRKAFLQLAGAAQLARPFVSAGEPLGARFTDITITAGLGGARNISGSALNKRLLLEEMGCGVAIIDYDNDGWPDIFLVNGAFLDPIAGHCGRLDLVEIAWPSGASESFRNIAADHLLVIRESEGIVRREKFGPR